MLVQALFAGLFCNIVFGESPLMAYGFLVFYCAMYLGFVHCHCTVSLPCPALPVSASLRAHHRRA